MSDQNETYNRGRNLGSSRRTVLALGLSAMLWVAPVQAETPNVESLPVGKATFEMGFDTYSDTEAINTVAKVMLEQLGYTVTLHTFDVGVLYAAVASGEVDVYSGGILPNHHKDYWERFGATMEKVGPFEKEFKAGLAVPAFVTEVNSIADLKEHGALFGGQILGESAGTGNMRQTAEAIEDYGLDMQLVESSEAAQTAAITKAMESKTPLVFVATKPHWRWAKWDLKLLEDPKLSFGEGDWVWHSLRSGLKEDSPRAYAFYENYHMSADQQGYLMLKVAEGEKAEEVARKFIADNPDLVKKWLGK